MPAEGLWRGLVRAVVVLGLFETSLVLVEAGPHEEGRRQLGVFLCHTRYIGYGLVEVSLARIYYGAVVDCPHVVGLKGEHAVEVVEGKIEGAHFHKEKAAVEECGHIVWLEV